MIRYIEVLLKFQLACFSPDDLDVNEFLNPDELSVDIRALCDHYLNYAELAAQIMQLLTFIQGQFPPSAIYCSISSTRVKFLSGVFRKPLNYLNVTNL